MLLAVLADQMLKTFVLVKTYLLGEVVFLVSRMPHLPEYEHLIVKAPSDVYIPDAALSPFKRAVIFIFSNPVFFLKLSFRKLLFFVTHVRPYWSDMHNVYNLLIIFPAYLFSAVALYTYRINTNMKLFFAVYVLMHITIVCFTINDYDGRSYMPVLPVLFVLAGGGAAYIIRKTRSPFLKSG